MKLINQLRYKYFYVSPNSIVYCLKENKYCDYTQFAKDKFHPHAGINRGVFHEDKKGLIKINRLNWDKPGVKFNQLLEFKALKEHYHNKKKWRNSNFAIRLRKFILIKQRDNSFTKSNVFHKLSNYFQNENLINNPNKIDELILRRENLINKLFDSIIKNAIIPIKNRGEKKDFTDNISINVGKGGKIFFNNRGHHRLSIAKIIKLKSVPVKITVVKNIKILNDFIKKYGFE